MFSGARALGFLVLPKDVNEARFRIETRFQNLIKQDFREMMRYIARFFLKMHIIFKISIIS